MSEVTAATYPTSGEQVKKVKKIIIRRRVSLWDNFPVLLLAIVYAGFFVIDDFGISAKIFVVIMAAALLVHILLHLKDILDYSPTRIFACFFGIVILIVLNIRELDYFTRHPFYLFTLFYSLLTIPFMRFNLKTAKTLFVLLIIPGLIAATLIILNKVSASTYQSYVLSFLSKSSAEEYYFLRGEGYGAVMGRNIGLTGSYLTTGMILSFVYLLRGNRKNKGLLVLFALMFLYMGVGLLFLNRRGEPLGLLLALYVILLIHSKKRQAILMFTLPIGILLALTLALFIYVIPSDVFGANSRLFALLQSAKGVDITNGRARLYAIAIDLFAKNPVFGVGWGGFAQYGSKSIEIVNNVHNIYLQLFTELGVFSVIILLVLIILIIREAKKNRPPLSLWSISAYGLIAFILAFGLFDNPIFQDYFFVYFIPVIYFLGLGRKNTHGLCTNIRRGNRSKNEQQVNS